MRKFDDEVRRRFRDVFNRDLDTEHPSTFNEWVLKLGMELSPEEMALRTRCADKYLVRGFFKERLGEDIGVPIENVFRDVEELRDFRFDGPHMVKCNHGSCFNFVCQGGYFKSGTLALIRECMRTPWFIKNYEMWYKDIPRLLISERLLDGVRDIRAYCSDGKVKLYEVCIIKSRLKYAIDDTGRPNRIRTEHYGDGNRLTYYDTEWKHIPELVRCKFPNVPDEPDGKPGMLDTMKRYAEGLSRGFPFVRVDFIVSGNECHCEELTFAPGGGFSPLMGDGDELLGKIVFG